MNINHKKGYEIWKYSLVLVGIIFLFMFVSDSLVGESRKFDI